LSLSLALCYQRRMGWLLALVIATAMPASLDRALALEAQGADAQAAAELDRVLAEHPTYGLAHLEAGRIALKRAEQDRARLELSTASVLLPENPRAQFFFGMMEQERGALASAEAALERAVALRPDYVEARVRLGALYLAQGDALHAEAHLQAAVAADPSQPIARLQLARALEGEGRTEDAERALTALHAEQPSSALVTRALATFYERTGRPALARSIRGEKATPPKRKLRPLRPSRR
jgi:Tfp pilus assembly protein PilF